MPKTLIFLGALVTGIAGLGFLWFIGQFRALLATTESGGRLGSLGFGAGLVFLSLWWVSSPIDVGVAATMVPA